MGGADENSVATGGPESPKPDLAHCPRCQYALSAVGTPRCPECGLSLDPASIRRVERIATARVAAVMVGSSAGAWVVLVVVQALSLNLAASDGFVTCATFAFVALWLVQAIVGVVTRRVHPAAFLGMLAACSVMNLLGIGWLTMLRGINC